MKQLLAIYAIGASILLHGCATIVTGKDQNVTFQSDPESATVSIDGRLLGKTPLTAKVDRKTGQSVTIEKEGYKPFTAPMSTTLNSWFLGNILLGGFFGTTTDAASGSLHEYSPNQYFAHLVPIAAPFGLQGSRSADIKRLVLAFGPDLRLELASSGGEHVDQLMAALGVSQGDRAQAFVAIRNVAAATPDDYDLAVKLVSVFEVDAAAPAASSQE